MTATYEVLRTTLGAAERSLERRIGQARQLATQGKQAEAEAQQSEVLAEALEEAVGFLNSFADERQASTQAKIEALVTHGLQVIFGDDLRFKIVAEQKARRSEVKFLLSSGDADHLVETSILDARGGGVAAVTGFLLRLIVLLLTPGLRRVLVLDESFAQLSVEYEPRLADLLREVVDKTGVQVLLITHSASYGDAADAVYSVRQRDGKTEVSKQDG